MTVTVRVEGFAELDRALAGIAETTGRSTTGRNVIRRTLRKAAAPIAAAASSLAPRGETGRLIGSIMVASQLTRRHRRDGKQDEVEVYIGPASGTGAINYASFVEFGTIDTPPHPFMRVAWEANKHRALEIIGSELGTEIEKTAKRLARRAAG